MKIEKIKNYNQHLLAILGTLGCLFLLLWIVWVIIELYPSRSYTNQPQGLIAEKTAETLNQENLRKQLISYESPWLIDTLNVVYVVPVSIKTLKKPEEVTNKAEQEVYDMSNPRSSFSKSKGYYSKRYFDGKYANLIIYDPKEEKTTSLFNERLIIGNVTTYYFEDDILLVCYTATKDTNQNGIIDLEDHRSLCVYSLKNGTMRKISDGDNQLEGFEFIEDSKNMLITFTLSQYEHRQFDNHQIPSKIMKYDYQSQKLEDTIPQDIREEMQKIVEGK